MNSPLTDALLEILENRLSGMKVRLNDYSEYGCQAVDLETMSNECKNMVDMIQLVKGAVKREG